MKIEPGNYSVVSSDEQLLIAVALFTASGFNFDSDEIFLGDSWEFGIPSCLAAEENSQCHITFVKEFKENNDKAVEIFLPSAKNILESLD